MKLACCTLHFLLKTTKIGRQAVIPHEDLTDFSNPKEVQNFTAVPQRKVL